MPAILMPFSWDEFTAKICDEYCRFPRECECEDELAEHCESCPLAMFEVKFGK